MVILWKKFKLADCICFFRCPPRCEAQSAPSQQLHRCSSIYLGPWNQRGRWVVADDLQQICVASFNEGLSEPPLPSRVVCISMTILSNAWKWYEVLGSAWKCLEVIWSDTKWWKIRSDIVEIPAVSVPIARPDSWSSKSLTTKALSVVPLVSLCNNVFEERWHTRCQGLWQVQGYFELRNSTVLWPMCNLSVGMRLCKQQRKSEPVEKKHGTSRNQDLWLWAHDGPCKPTH